MQGDPRATGQIPCLWQQVLYMDGRAGAGLRRRNQ